MSGLILILLAVIAATIISLAWEWRSDRDEMDGIADDLDDAGLHDESRAMRRGIDETYNGPLN